MKCRWCKGRGDHGTYDPHDPYWAALGCEEDPADDPGVTLCCVCDGSGMVSIRQVARWKWSSLAEDVSYSAIGRWWWCSMGRRIRVRRLCRHKNGLQLAALAGHRWKSLQTFVKHSENICGIERYVDTARRLYAEAQDACARKPV